MTGGTSKEYIVERSFSVSLWMIVAVLAAGKIWGGWAISWLWVFCPIWIPMVFTLGILGIILAFCLFVFAIAMVAMGWESLTKGFK